MLNRFVFMAAGIGLASLSGADQLVTNGGFETGSLSGWTLGGTANAFVVSSPVHSGSFSAKLTPGSSTNTLSQVLATQAGATYSISVWLDHEGGDSTGNTAEIDWNGSALPGFPLSMQPSSGWVDYTFSEAATSSATTISITAHDPSGNIFLDDVSVQTSAVPEPCTMLALGLGAVGILRRRKSS